MTREYYVNDAGSQMEAFYRSVLARYRQFFGQDAPMPPNGYMGDYIADLAQEIADAEGERFLNQPEEQAVREIGDLGREKMVGLIREDLSTIGVEFDNWFSERTLYNPRPSTALEAQDKASTTKPSVNSAARAISPRGKTPSGSTPPCWETRRTM